MFYEDDDNISTVEAGRGDVIFMAGLQANLKNGTLSVVENCGICHEIGEVHNFKEMTKDYDLNTVFRLVFTNPKSIDALIDQLKTVKFYMEDPKNHPWYDEICLPSTGRSE